jgi:N-acetylmuramidase
MTATRRAGPTCGWELNIDSLDDGTCELWQFDSPQESPWASRTLDSGAHRTPTTDLPVHSAPLWCAIQVPDVTFLFNSCRNPKQGLSTSAIDAAAAQLAVEPAAAAAVADVETGGNSFDPEGRPRILFERHVFRELTAARFDLEAPDLSSRVGGGYGTFRSQYAKLEQAFRLDPWAALQSASWGGFQLMGRYYLHLGFSSPHHMVIALAQSEDAHLSAFVQYLRMNKAAHRALKRLDWPAFARAYNGPGYAKNRYGAKMESAYAQQKAAREAAAQAAAAKATQAVRTP